MLTLDVFPAQMDRLMLICANPLRSTRHYRAPLHLIWTVEETVKQDGDADMRRGNRNTRTRERDRPQNPPACNSTESVLTAVALNR